MYHDGEHAAEISCHLNGKKVKRKRKKLGPHKLCGGLKENGSQKATLLGGVAFSGVGVEEVCHFGGFDVFFSSFTWCESQLSVACKM